MCFYLKRIDVCYKKAFATFVLVVVWNATYTGKNKYINQQQNQPDVSFNLLLKNP